MIDGVNIGHNVDLIKVSAAVAASRAMCHSCKSISTLIIMPVKSHCWARTSSETLVLYFAPA